MNKNYFQRWVRHSLILFLVVAVGVTTGCEPLRKKFVRKKKDEEIEKPEVILDPQNYPAKIKTVLEAYSEHYGLWKVWFGELSRVEQESLGDKKVIATLTQMQVQIVEMQKLLSSQAQTRMGNVLFSLNELQKEFEKPENMRNKNYISSLLRSMDRIMRESFSPKKVGGLLKTS